MNLSATEIDLINLPCMELPSGLLNLQNFVVYRLSADRLYVNVINVMVI